VYLFDNYPRDVSQDYYGVAREQIINSFKSNKDVISIYEYGSVSSPGVSDLDIILILNNKTNTKEEDLGFSNINRDVYSLVMDGNVMKMPQGVFTKLNYFDPFNLKKLSGKDIIVDTISADDASMLEVISIVDWLPERILRLTKMLNSEVINISNVLCILHSFSYSIKKINKITGHLKKSEDILHTIHLLRNDWQSFNNPEDKLVGCIKDSITLGYEYLLKFMEYIDIKGIYESVDLGYQGDITLELFDKHYIRFVGKELYSKLEKNAALSSDKEKSFVTIPNFYYPHFDHLSSTGGLLSNVMKDKIKPYPIINSSILCEKYKMLLSNKINLAEENAQFLTSNNFKKGLIRYGFHFRY
jgi:hypothetical protein